MPHVASIALHALRLCSATAERAIGHVNSHMKTQAMGDTTDALRRWDEVTCDGGKTQAGSSSNKSASSWPKTLLADSSDELVFISGS